MRFFLIILIFFASTYIYAEDSANIIVSEEITKSISNHLKGKNASLVQNLYVNTGYTPLWINNNKKMQELLSALKDPLFNYKEKDLGQKEIEKLLFMIDNNEVRNKEALYARLDAAFSSSFISLVKFISQGDVDWNLVQKKIAGLKYSDDIRANWDMTPNNFPDQKIMATAVLDGNIYGYLKSILPLEDRYVTLVEIYKKYRNMEPFEQIPYSSEILQVGSNSPRVMLVKKRLQTLGDYPAYTNIDPYFDTMLYNAVLRYQKRYNIEETGKIDNVTNYYLNQPLSAHLNSIVTNLDKTKIYPRNLNDERIEINVPSYHFTYFQNNEPVLSTKAVVGRIDRPTPIFNDYVEYLVLNPTWTVTDNLIKKDLIGVLRENPNYLVDHNIHVFSGNDEVTLGPGELDAYENSSAKVPFRFVQDPGENNALGKVKFIFPNPYDVYLHDTDNKDLFNRRYRVYSSGCMRIQQPLELATMLLENHTDGKYNASSMEDILDTNKTTTIRLNQPIPINILYFTVHKDDGLVYFDYDVYMYDLIIQESTEDNRKEYFTVPKQRMIRVEKNAKTDNTPAP
ncbi:MAG: L,D-transpeptidase family protein [Sulfurovaceae bacterium]|nr:L,D-transpeptidase family protein [Sulfurovaceae bacterium]